MKKKRLRHQLKPSRHQRAIARLEHKHEVELDLLYRVITGMLVQTETGEVHLGQTDLRAYDLGYRFGTHYDVTADDSGTLLVRLIEPADEDDVVYLKDESEDLASLPSSEET